MVALIANIVRQALAAQLVNVADTIRIVVQLLCKPQGSVKHTDIITSYK